MRASSASLLFSCVRTSHQVFTSRRWEGRNAKWLLCVSSGGLLASFYCPCHQTSSERGGLAIPLSVCCLILAPDAPVHAHTHTHLHRVSLFHLLVSSVRRLGLAWWKLWGHRFLLIFIIFCPETEGRREGRREQAREETLSSLCPPVFFLSLSMKM